ncbi:hypothetical protein F0344_04805 [Streptomyces finlayi]|uniref:Uncharacterized protein n=1 Tax=Streptomyces finlayi TaxID=67296 RepID=A0A7G7BF97_9ACTN|nr:hypothetical protein [Streptomyces finlayi]QNE74012.1 hypothetical protein F0344_04805 [Streptomyces finlayi]
MASTTGTIKDAYAFGGSVTLHMNPVYCDVSRPLAAGLTPDEARLLGLKLIRLADTAEKQEW